MRYSEKVIQKLDNQGSNSQQEKPTTVGLATMTEKHLGISQGSADNAKRN